MKTRRWQWWVAILLLLFFLGAAYPVAAQDYVITFLKETYKDQGDAGKSKVYHTWAISSDFGNKLLILSGSDNVQRQWLREFIKDHTQFLLNVPDKETGAFELNRVYTTDVNRLHPIDDSFLGKKGKKRKKKRKK